MAKKFLLKLYTGFKLFNYQEEILYNEHTNDVEFTPETDEYCLTFKDFTFNEEIDKPIYDVCEGLENVHKLFLDKKLATDKEKRIEFIITKNNEQSNIAIKKLAKWKDKRTAYPNSLTVLRKIQYLETVLSEFNQWYDVIGLEFPDKSLIDSNSSLQPFKNKSADSISLAAFMRLLLKDKDAKKFFNSTQSFDKRIQFVKDAIKEKKLNVKKYKPETLKRYIEPKKILEFQPKKKKSPKIP